MVQSKLVQRNALHELGYKIFLDRYAQKDMTRATLAVGDTVIAVVDSATGQREIGTVKAINLPSVTVELLDGEVITRDVEHVDKPLETDPGQMMDRVAAGIAAAEATPELRELWTERFRWLLDDWKFVPAGRILAAAGTNQALTFYNCMPPEQQVLTADGYKPIAEVAVGELVVTHRNRLRPVRRKFERETVEPLYIIKPKKLGYDDLRVTGDHKILAIRSAWVNSHRSRDGLRLKHEPAWIPARELHPGDYLAVGHNGEECPPEPILLSDYLDGYRVVDGLVYRPTERNAKGQATNWGTHYSLKNRLDLDEDLCYLFGRWLGDGCVTHRSGTTIPSGIKIVFGLDEKAEAERVAAIIEAKFGLEPSLKLSSTGRWYDLWANSMPLGEFFKAFFGAYSYGKTIPDHLLHMPRDLTLSLLKGLFKADGYVSGKYIGLLLSNRALTIQVHQLLLRLGYFFSIRENTHRLGRVPAFRLTSSGSDSEDLFLYFFDQKAPERSYDLKSYLDYDGLKWIRIDNIAIETYRGVVMDMEVEEDHSFISAGVVVSNCYVIPSPRDSRGGIIETLHQMTEIMSRGGGVGINISTLRPRHAFVKGVNGRSSGAVSWGALYSFVTGLIEQGGSRRGALMLILNDWHPDIFNFINSKRQAGQITNANISVNVSDKLMEAVKADGDWDLMFPDTSDPEYDHVWDGNLDQWIADGRKVIKYRTVKAREVWNAIIESAWASAEPGVWFGERSNKMSNSYYFNPLICTNPCTTGDTLVSTEFGYTRARDLQVGMKIRTPAGLKPIEKIYNNGKQRIYCVTFSDGGSLECTADHKLKVVRDKRFEWVAVKDLQIGDRVQVMANEAFGPRRRLPEAAIAFIEKRHLNVADVYDRNLGFLVGAVLGDGTLRRVKSRNSHAYICRVAFGAQEAEWMSLFRERVEAMGIHTHASTTRKEIPQPDGTVVVHQSVGVDCYKLATLMVRLGMPTNVKAPDKAIPESFMTLDREFLAGLLDGLFSTDGGLDMNRSNPMLRFHTSSAKLAQQVRLLLLQFGIHARIYESKRAPDLSYDGRSMVGTGVKYDVLVMNEGIARFYSEIGLSHPEKQAKLKDVAENTHFLGGSWTAAVKSVVDTGREEDVFDLYEPDTLTWVTNGYVSLDCGEQSLGAWSVCNLGALNLARFYDEANEDVDWETLDVATRYATRFLDNVIDTTPYFYEENRQRQLSERRVGLNNMGLAELLIRLGIRYGSEESVAFIDKLYKFMARAAYETSIELAREKGPFPLFDADKFVKSGFIRSLPKDIQDNIRKHGIRNVTILTQAPTGCVAPDTLISTASGMEPIVNMGDPNGLQWQVLSRDVHTDVGLRKTSHFYVNGRQATKTLTTKRGFSLTATPNHRIRVIDADGNYVWRRMDEIATGEKVVLKRNTLTGDQVVHLTPVEQGNRALSKLPATMTPELAELLGLYMGDGYLKKRGGLHIVVGNQDPDLIDYVADRMRAVWGERYVGAEPHVGCTVLNLTGYYIPRFFEANGFAKPSGNHGEGAAGAFIPSKVLEAGRACVIAFLRGLFESDGSIHRGTITLTSTSRQLIRQTQIALLGLGIVSSVRVMPPADDRFGRRELYELRVLNRREAQRFVEVVGFLSQRKQRKAQTLGPISDRGDSIAVPALCEEFYAQSRGLRNDVRQQIIGLVGNGALTQQFVRATVAEHPVLEQTRLAQLVLMDVYVDEVSSIEDGECDTYDLSVPGNHTYIANGFVSHNTTGTMVNTSTGIEPFFSWVYYRKSRLGLHEEQVPLVKEWREKHPNETELPDYFVTAMDLAPEDHVRVQAAIQRWVDSSISKTCNVPQHYTVEQTRALYELMYELGCKGGTIYRDGSRDEQVLMLKGDDRAESEIKRREKAERDEPEAQATPHRVYPRPKKLHGATVSCQTPFGKAYITMNSDENGAPFEVFITAPGKAGSDLQADADGLGRLISLQLRSVAPVNRRQMLKLIIDQLQGIGGSRSIGMGPSRVMSLPDAVAGALEEHYFAEDSPQQLQLPMATTDPQPAANVNGTVKAGEYGVISGADMCPSCHTVSLIRAEGCRKCLTCGYSEC